MNPSRIVVALGGNALGKTPTEQKEAIAVVADALVELLKKNHRLVIGHGNGPQVGAINLAFEYGHAVEAGIPEMPFAECNAMSQGYIGYHMQQVLSNKLRENGVNRPVASVVTQVEVDPQDHAFQNPTKPVGLFYTKEESESLAAKRGWTFIEDSGRGYRRVVPSPLPKNIVELETVRAMLSSNIVVITVGGGGIPVVNTGGQLTGTDAVIDKDESSSLIAAQLGADTLLVLTGVPNMYINFGTPEQQQLDEITASEAARYLEEGQFGTGSMKPKVEACLRFLEGQPNGRAIVTSIENVTRAIEEGAGTVIRSDAAMRTPHHQHAPAMAGGMGSW